MIITAGESIGTEYIRVFDRATGKEIHNVCVIDTESREVEVIETDATGKLLIDPSDNGFSIRREVRDFVLAIPGHAEEFMATEYPGVPFVLQPRVS